MNELIKVTQNEKGEQLISARELHKKLGITERFNSWFERMLKYGFIENVDFTSVKDFTVVNNGAKKEIDEYILKLDTAKQICMLQRNELGTKFRLYFIECEKKLLESNNYNSLNTRVTFLENAFVTMSKAVETLANDIAPAIKLIAEKGKSRKTIKTDYDDSIETFAEEYIDVIFGRTNIDVYKDYINYCNSKNLDIANKITFGKRMKTVLGCEIIDKKINGKKYRIFIKN